jgi:hypothetical protein
MGSCSEAIAREAEERERDGKGGCGVISSLRRGSSTGGLDGMQGDAAAGSDDRMKAAVAPHAAVTVGIMCAIKWALAAGGIDKGPYLAVARCASFGTRHSAAASADDARRSDSTPRHNLAVAISPSQSQSLQSQRSRQTNVVQLVPRCWEVRNGLPPDAPMPPPSEPVPRHPPPTNKLH